MKKNVLKFGLFSMVLLGMVSCQNKEKEMADKRIMALESYVDSLKAVSAADLETNWEQISVDYDRKTTEANDAMASLDETTRTTSQAKVDATTAKYDEIKVSVTTSVEAKKMAATPATAPNAKRVLRDKLFMPGQMGDDMSFSWVNKDNILSVYDKFFESYKTNKGSFSREDYDEIKLMYEALDSRKNSVEKEGLSSEDNTKIASIKFKFGPMFKINRMGAKSEENQEAKE